MPGGAESLPRLRLEGGGQEESWRGCPECQRKACWRGEGVLSGLLRGVLGSRASSRGDRQFVGDPGSRPHKHPN